jgi:hypothetical protein
MLKQPFKQNLEPTERSQSLRYDRLLEAPPDDEKSDALEIAAYLHKLKVALQEFGEDF